jgi:hypothetical protein
MHEKQRKIVSTHLGPHELAPSLEDGTSLDFSFFCVPVDFVQFELFFDFGCNLSHCSPASLNQDGSLRVVAASSFIKLTKLFQVAEQWPFDGRCAGLLAATLP